MSFALEPRQCNTQEMVVAPLLVAATGAAVHDANDTNSFHAVPAERQIEAVIPSICSHKPPFLTSRPCLTPAKPHPHIPSLQRPLAPCHTLCNTLARSYLATAILAGTIIWWIDWVQTQFRFRLGAN
jgi:hypothetical protein